MLHAPHLTHRFGRKLAGKLYSGGGAGADGKDVLPLVLLPLTDIVHSCTRLKNDTKIEKRLTWNLRLEIVGILSMDFQWTAVLLLLKRRPVCLN